MHKRLFPILILVFIASVAFSGCKKNHYKSGLTRKPVVLIVPRSPEHDKIFKAWNQRLGKPYDIVSDAPLFDNVERLKKAKVGIHAWMSPSVSDIQKSAASVPKSIAWVIYDFEYWKHTPKSERSNVVSASKALRKLCDKRQWKMCFIPIYGAGLRMAAKLAPYYDGYIVQCQKFQNDKKRKKTIAYLREIKKTIHKQNPKCLVGCQLGSRDRYGNGKSFSGVQAALLLYDATKDFLDIYSIWWPPEADRLIALLEGMEEIHRKNN
jgi:hypothetical protein